MLEMKRQGPIMVTSNEVKERKKEGAVRTRSDSDAPPAT